MVLETLSMQENSLNRLSKTTLNQSKLTPHILLRIPAWVMQIGN